MTIHHQRRSVPLRSQQTEGTAMVGDPLAGQLTQITSPSRPVLGGQLQPIQVDIHRLRKSRIVTLDRGHPAAASFDILRTKILRLAREHKWTTIGITAPTSQSGTTTLALNLALSFSHQTDHRTLLLDLNLRNPRLATLLGCDKMDACTDFLGGEKPVDTTLLRYGEALAISAVAKPVASPAEVLQAKSTGKRLEVIREALAPDIILVDAPPVLQRDDFEATRPHYDGVLLVADTQRTLLADIDRCERELSEQTKVIGVVLNRCRFAH